ncbi:hypothetical protein BDV34DRAFT_195272 [Aspergillus parasiticus]|uniref:Uncharacterized protein n=1 Tax=Aspergillus parasiticus TaxID=5067 RepID=A0A5N6DL40_ASPPA|nr:hypothetical protein BDV34DRAFT_195272 [Aspergillus parasiticus]
MLLPPTTDVFSCLIPFLISAFNSFFRRLCSCISAFDIFSELPGVIPDTSGIDQGLNNRPWQPLVPILLCACRKCQHIKQLYLLQPKY